MCRGLFGGFFAWVFGCLFHGAAGGLEFLFFSARCLFGLDDVLGAVLHACRAASAAFDGVAVLVGGDGCGDEGRRRGRCVPLAPFGGEFEAVSGLDAGDVVGGGVSVEVIVPEGDVAACFVDPDDGVDFGV